MKRLAQWLVAICLTLNFGGLALAQSNVEEIENFNTNININRNNAATITETIEYNFGFFERHGIERWVPIETKIKDDYRRFYYHFKLLAATIDGHKVKSQVRDEGVYKVIRLGDPNRTIGGVHSYTISYQMDPVIQRDGDGDYLNWNLVGSQWKVPIAAASAQISFADGVKVLQSRCYSGPSGSTAQDCNVSTTEDSLSINSKDSLTPGEDMTVNALVTPNSFTKYQVPTGPPAHIVLPVLGYVVGVLAVVFGVIGRILSWMVYRYKRKRQLIIPQYAAPDKLKPGEIGLLNDNVANMSEVTATLIDLAVRGYIRIEQTQAKKLFKKAEYKFHKLKDYSGLSGYEKDLLDLFFGSGKQTATLKSVSASKAATVIKDAKEQMKKDLQKKGYYEMGKASNWRGRLMRRFFWLVVLVVVFGNLYAWLKGANFGNAALSDAVMFVGMIIGWAISKRDELTHAGYAQWAKIQGLKLFLSVTEKERLKFHDAPAKNPKQFNELLPYAVALGVEKQWAKQFEGMDVSRGAGWYSGHHALTPYVLASSLSSDFSSSVSSNFTPTQSSSGGSSGGGFSGGGFSGGGGGGGGGGSW